MSYGVYLWHQAWVYMFLRWTNLLFKLAWWKMLLPVLALSIGTTTISYFVVERPILSLKDRLAWWSGPSKPAVVPVPARAEHAVADVANPEVADAQGTDAEVAPDQLAGHDAAPGEAVGGGTEEPA